MNGWNELWAAALAHAKYYEALYQAVSAVSTAAALITTLVLSWLTLRRDVANKVKAYAYLGSDIYNQHDPRIMIKVTNIGPVSLVLERGCFFWKVPFGGLSPIVETAFDTAFQNDEEIQFPIRLKLNETALIGNFRLRALDIAFHDWPAGFAPDQRLSAISLVLVTPSGSRFNVKLGEDVRRRIKKWVHGRHTAMN